MWAIISAGIAPGLALLSYFYLKDEYETEPLSLVLRMFLYGTFLVFPLMFIQHVLKVEHMLPNAFVEAFLSTSLLEEFFKWFVFYYAIYDHREFNEPYDGIVYGVSVSLGFATLENILYLFANGVEFAVTRALLPVSSHALFGVIMGFYLGRAKFGLPKKEKNYIWLSFLLPFLFHGIYDYILLTQERWIYYMLPFMIFLWWLALRKVKLARGMTIEMTQSSSQA
ncbi:protease [Anoxybacillus gonensis]|uniref:Protease PrsW n=1 Tax=Anoxybacillus gonensis TaxID=198467 RepID=A0AAW7THW2_9BACL|nr:MULTISPECIES: glutamic-type intramembrane protease PrsW [Anoxybacillus]AXM90042.1 PrsW family intramembrane metalloprotease [Anoxybacillus ayderensis G10]AKS38701.1 protease [Anoxybacillus gonensis]KGP60187.1 protease [Anoxybacillus gonensis]MBW9218139.1 intramembrane metalloprotease PrsW [Anoxybacillus sp. ST70]MCQ5364534.1 glutamic-type intramembrane protease PrsW [Anoxybacillus gonensis]